MGDKVSLELSRAEKLGIIESPRIISSGYSIAETGGNDDPKMFPLDFAEKISYSYYADGAWECIKAVRKNIRAGAESIKAYASSSFVGGGSVRNELSVEELRSISGEAKKYGVPSAAHAYGAFAIENVIESGFASVEHGLGLNEDLAERMASTGIFYTPTMSVYKAQRGNSSAYRDSYIKRHLEKEVTIADSAGVKIVAGTDFVGSTEERHGNNYLEAVYLSQVIGN
jgi:imidazolonepropionase-like amidohydrolase